MTEAIGRAISSFAEIPMLPYLVASVNAYIVLPILAISMAIAAFFVARGIIRCIAHHVATLFILIEIESNVHYNLRGILRLRFAQFWAVLRMDRIALFERSAEIAAIHTRVVAKVAEEFTRAVDREKGRASERFD